MANFTPMAELPQELDESRRTPIAWQFEPGMHVDRDAIGVNVPGMQRIARAAGFGGIVVRQYFGDTTQYKLEGGSITSLGQDGTATGGASMSVARAEGERSSVQRVNREQLPNYQWPVASLEINRSELAQRIGDLTRQGMGGDQAWARELNRSLKRGLRSAIKDKLQLDATSTPYRSLVDGSYLGTALTTVPAMAFIHPLSAVVMYPVTYASLAAYEAFRNLQVTGDTQIDQKRWSLFFGPVQPDRLALASVMAATAKLAKHKPRNKS